MDPYLEPHWLDVHTVLIGEARRALNRSLPPGLVARAEERVAVESDDHRLYALGPDVRVFSPSSADQDSGGIAIQAPFELVVDLDPVIERFLRVFDESGRLLTVIEFISPTNKRRPGLTAFRRKREKLLKADVHVVEVDLVRAGNWRALMRPEGAPAEAISVYRTTVRTAGRPPRCFLFPITLRQPLPDIPIPLRRTDQPVDLPLQALFDAAYADGRYDQTIDYSRPLDPPLEAKDAAWAEQLLRSAGRLP
jgi:hypothetical protein